MPNASRLALPALIVAVMAAAVLLFATVAYGQDNVVAAYRAELSNVELGLNSSPSESLAQLGTLRQRVRNASGLTNEDSIRLRADALRLEGASLIQLTRYQSARDKLEVSRDMLLSAELTGSELGDTLRTVAYLDYLTGDVGKALREATQAYEILRETSKVRSQALTLVLLGVIYRDARDFERATRYYRDAVALYDEEPSLKLANLNNLGLVYLDQDQPDRALAAFGEAVEIADSIDSAILQARIQTNIADAHLKKGELRSAITALDRGEALAPPAQDAGWQAFITGMRARVYAAQDNVADAERLLDEMFAGDDLAETPANYRDFHETAVTVYRAQGRSEDALEHFAALKRLDDEAAQVSASANNAILAAQFDFAGQEVEIANLRTSQLESDIQIAEERAVFNQRIVIGVLAASAIIISLTLLALYMARRRRQEVDAANVELGRTNTDLEKALNAKSEFLATTSHEIRTPLNGVLGMTQIMLADRNLPEDVRERVGLVHGAGTSMKAIVDDILDVAKMESGVVALRREPFDLRDTLEEVSRIFADNAAEKGLDYQIELDDCPVRAIGDEQRVRQVVLNLVSNAVKFTNEGHVRLTARPSLGDTDALSIEISDTGIGIPEDQQDAVFAAFHQVDSTRTRAFSGTGLGLTISRELVHAMHGDLTLESAVGEGTSFALTLPLSLEIANAGQRLEAAAPSGCSFVLYAPNALVEMIATRALGDAASGIDISHDHSEALGSARTAHALILAYGTAAEAPQLDELAALRKDRPDLFIVAAGWPADAGIDATSLCDRVVDDIPSLAQMTADLLALDEEGADETRNDETKMLDPRAVKLG